MKKSKLPPKLTHHRNHKMANTYLNTYGYAQYAAELTEDQVSELYAAGITLDSNNGLTPSPYLTGYTVAAREYESESVETGHVFVPEMLQEMLVKRMLVATEIDNADIENSLPEIERIQKIANSVGENMTEFETVNPNATDERKEWERQKLSQDVFDAVDEFNAKQDALEISRIKQRRNDLYGVEF